MLQALPMLDSTLSLPNADAATVAKGNKKLGNTGLIHAWSIPAITTCPGRSALCERLCYATEGFYFTPDVRKSLQKNHQFSMREEFIHWMVRTIQRRKIRVFRIHVAGDFYSPAYASKWLEIARACPDTDFFLFTRTWRNPETLPVLLKLGALPNVYLWFSADQETGQPVAGSPRVRTAYMLTDSELHAAFPVDLYFRDDAHLEGAVRKEIASTLVCPQEQGFGHRTTCEKCQICFTPAARTSEGKRHRVTR